MKEILSDNGVIQTVIQEEDGFLYAADVMSGKNVQEILDQNARARNERMYNPHAHLKPAASIPTPLYYSWKQDWQRNHRDKWTWKTFLVSKINSYEYKNLRVTDSLVGLTSQDRG